MANSGSNLHLNVPPSDDCRGQPGPQFWVEGSDGSQVRHLNTPTVRGISITCVSLESYVEQREYLAIKLHRKCSPPKGMKTRPSNICENLISAMQEWLENWMTNQSIDSKQFSWLTVCIEALWISVSATEWKIIIVDTNDVIHIDPRHLYLNS